MRVKVELPLRVDLGGGITDIPELSREVGVSIANIAVDLYDDKNYSTKRCVSIEASTSKGRSRLFLNEQEISLHNPADSIEFFSGMFCLYLNKLQITEGVTLKIKNLLPNGTGLGASAAMSLGVLASLYKLKGGPKVLQPDRLVKEAYYFETVEKGLKGGFQDYIAAYFGGYSYINFNSLDSKDLSNSSMLGQRLKEAVVDFLNESMIFVLRRSDNISSSVIAEDEVANFIKEGESIEPHLRNIINANQIINDIICGHLGIDWRERLAREINSSWESQKHLSGYICRGLIREIEEIAGPYVYALRGPGSGGNSLFLLARPEQKAQLIKKLSNLDDKIAILYGRVNHRGLRILEP